jgi:hypothetical protein
VRTPAQALREAIDSGAVEAWHKGEPIQSRLNDNPWALWRQASEADCPVFQSASAHWRPAFVKRRIPFTLQTVPKWALWRVAGTSHPFFTVNVYGMDGVIFESRTILWSEIADSFECSLDNGATWSPGSQEVES